VSGTPPSRIGWAFAARGVVLAGRSTVIGSLFALVATWILALTSAPVPTPTTGVSLATVVFALVEPAEVAVAADALEEEPAGGGDSGAEVDAVPAVPGAATSFVRLVVIERSLPWGAVREAPGALARWHARVLGARGPPIG
jgi:hypothetical protein